MKVVHIHKKEGIDKTIIYVFNGLNSDKLDKLFLKDPTNKVFDGIFTAEELVTIRKNSTLVRFIPDQIHLDDTIEIIKKKIVLHLIDLNAAFEELYLFIVKPEKFTAATLYQNLTQKEKLELTKARLVQFLLNIEDFDVTALLASPKTIYTYDDLLELNLENSLFSVSKPLGQKMVSLKDDYPYTVNPYQAAFYDTFIEKFADEIVTTTNKNILMDHGSFVNNTIYLCLAEEVLAFGEGQQLPLAETSTLKIYFPYLNKKDITSLEQLTERKQELLKDTKALLTPTFIKNIENINLFYDIYALRKEEMNFQGVGIKSLIVMIHQTSNFHLPLDNVFKLIHATQDVPLIKMNLSKRQENIYRLYADKIATNGKKIPYLDKGAIFKWDKVMGKTKSVSVYIEHYEEETSSIAPILCEFNSNGSIVIKATFGTSLSPEAVNELFIKEVNPVINVIKDYLAQDGHTLNNFDDLKEHELINIEYTMHIQIEKDIQVKKIAGCLTSMFNVINDNLKHGIILRFKRVSNYNEMESQEALIMDMAQPQLGYSDNDIIKVLQSNFQLSEKAAVEKYAEVKRAQEALNKRYKKGNNPGFLTTIVKQPYNNTVVINVSGINQLDYLQTLSIYFDSLIRITQKQESTQVTKLVIKNKCTGNEIAEEKQIEEITVANIPMTIVAEELVFTKRDEENSFAAASAAADDADADADIDLLDEDDLLARFGAEEEADEAANEVADANEESGGAASASEAAQEAAQEASATDEDEEASASAADASAAHEEADEDEALDTDITGQSLANPSPFEKRMIKYDKNLFVTDTGKKNFKSYATTCPWNRRRQPVVLTDDEKARIDREHPGSYSEAVQYGSTPAKKFWYICPRYWDLKKNVSLTEAEVDPDLVIPKKPLKNKVPAGKQILEFNYPDEHLDDKKNYVTHYPGFLKPDEKGKCLPCCFKSWNEPEQSKRRAQCTKDNTVVVLPGRKKKKAVEEIDEYILAPDKFPILQDNRFGYLPIAVQKFLHTDNKKCQISEMNTNIKQNHECLLRHSVEISHNQSFVACIADIWFETFKKIHKETTRPTIKRMKEIFRETLTIDNFVTLQNGNLIKLFHKAEGDNDMQSDNNINDLGTYAEIYSQNKSKLYELADKSNPNHLRALIKVAQAYTNFLDYLKDDTVEMDYEYLWDLICKPNPKLFVNGINMVIIELSRKDITDSVELICPSNHYAATFFDPKKSVMLILKIDNYYEPIYAYKTTATEITITRTFNMTYKDVMPNIKYVLGLIKKTLNTKCAALPSMPRVYKFEKPLVLEKLINELQLHNYVIDTQVMNYDSKIIGVVAINNQDNSKGFVPCYPSAALMAQGPIVYMNDAPTDSYEASKKFLTEVYTKTKRQVPCQPAMKVLEDGLIVGILTMTNQFVRIDEPTQDTFGKDLKIMQNVDYQAVDSKMESTTVDTERVNYIKKIQLETKFYNVFRTTARYLLGQYAHRDIRKEIEEKTTSTQLYLKKLKSIDTLLRELMKGQVEFYAYAENDLLKLDIITNCYTNCTNPVCHSTSASGNGNGNSDASGNGNGDASASENGNGNGNGDAKCVLRIPEINLINQKPNADFYYGKLADEIIRYSRVKNFIFNPKSVLSFSLLKYNLRENEIILLQSLLTQEYFENIVAAKVNMYIKNNTYDTTQPLIGQKYSNVDTLEMEKDQCNLVIKDQVADNYWSAIFPAASKEYIYGGADVSPLCSFQLLIALVQDQTKNTELTKNTIKEVLIGEYEKLYGDYEKQLFLIFKAQGKKVLAEQLAKKETTLDKAIISEDYYATTLDLWLLIVYYNLPVVFISETELIENNRKFLVANTLVNEKVFYFVKIAPQSYSLIRTAEEMLIPVESLRNATDLQTELKNAVPGGDHLKEFIENFTLTGTLIKKKTIKIAAKTTVEPSAKTIVEPSAKTIVEPQTIVEPKTMPIKKLNRKINIK